MLKKYIKYSREFLTVWYILVLYILLRAYTIFGTKYLGAIISTLILFSLAYFLIIKNYHWSIYIGACLSVYLLIALIYTLVFWRFFTIDYPWDVEIIARIALLLSVPLTGLYVKLVMKRFKMIQKHL